MTAKPKKKSGLGKGLSALFDDAETVIDDIISDSAQSDGVKYIPIIDIEPNKNQPRKVFDEEKLEALSESIKEHGVVSPVLVTAAKGDMYKIVAGERRWRASKLAGLKEIPCIIRDFTELEMSELALVENLQREDLNPIEEAEGYKYLMDKFSLTQDEVAKRIGKSRSAVANTLRLNGLSDKVKDYARGGELSSGHARTLVTLSKEQQDTLADKIIASGLNVRQTEALVKSVQNGKPTVIKKSENPLTKKYYKKVESDLSSRFGTKVKISEGAKKGKIEIEYYSKDDLERILFELKS